MYNLNPQSSINLFAAALEASGIQFTVDYHEDGVDFFWYSDISDNVISFDNDGRLLSIVSNDF